MQAIVVYESHWGNTAAVAQAIAEGIGPGARVLSTAEAQPTEAAAVDLLICGAPVIGFRLATPQAYDNMRVRPGSSASPDLSHPPMSSWLKSLPTGSTAVAAFDTQVRGPFGKAAPSILATLKKLGYRPLASARGFVVKGSAGPLRDGELERAREWGAELAAAVGQLQANIK